MGQWVSAWGYRAMDFSVFPVDVGNKITAVRFLNNIEGEKGRLLLSNVYGKKPLRIEHILVAEDNTAGSDKGWDFASASEVLINGNVAFEIAPGMRVYSDPVIRPYHSGTYITVFIVFGKDQLCSTACSCFPQTAVSAVSWEYTTGCLKELKMEEGKALSTKLLELEPEHQCFCGIEQMDIFSENEARTIVCFGDSITHRSLWTGPLAERLYTQYPGMISIINSGISGNRICYDASPFSPFGPWFGEAAIRRFEKDVFGRCKVDLVTVLMGINDIFHPLCGHAPQSETPTAESLEEGLLRIAQCAKRHQTKVIGCTITPWKDCMDLFNPASEEVRKKTNEWILNSGVFDDVLDFSTMIADPEDPEKMLSFCDSGDHVHPGAAGGLHMAQKVDLSIITGLLNLEG